ncbi:MAG: class I SAM-dependent DNA methyltransferase [Planctomycetes bacterium]|nr:class I SAM-dependent DNA methyltransferase [Planctomycetota bacterium]
MNAVEIEEAVSKLAEAPFDPVEFPYSFLEAFGNKETTIKRLRSRSTNPSDVTGGVLQRNNIHIAVCSPGTTAETLAALRRSPATSRHKCKYVLATDGQFFEAENVADEDPPIACPFAEFHERFAYFLPLAGISTVKQIRENAFDIKATGRLNRLYVELLKENPDWDTAARREDLNHFFARLIFCFFAEDTGIFIGGRLFTDTVQQMSERDSSNTHEVLSELFRAMNTKPEDRDSANLRNWAKSFPYVNGNLFSGSTDVPRFSKPARSYLLHVGSLDWTKINPDIFGSMIQAVADDEERGALGMHYTSVPNILKVLNPLFLDELRAELEAAGTNDRKLLKLRDRMARIRVFDPACGSGNFLVIAYKEMREIEAKINSLRGRADTPSEIPLTNFRGIELRHFSAEIARLALIIAEYQCDVLYRGHKIALAEFLPLDAANWITCGNALRLDWLSICPPTGTGTKLRADDLFSTPLDQTEIDFENEGGETYICGNPPYLGSVVQSAAAKSDLRAVFDDFTKDWKSLDYVAGWFFKAALYGLETRAASAFVATNLICQGEQVPALWPLIFGTGHRICFAYRSFNWANLASNNAGVTVVIVGISALPTTRRMLFDSDSSGKANARLVDNIGPYLTSGPDVIVRSSSTALGERGKMIRGNMPNDGGHLILSFSEANELRETYPCTKEFIRYFIGSKEFIHSLYKYCIWIEDDKLDLAMDCRPIRERIERVRETRLNGGKQAYDNVSTPHRFVFAPHRNCGALVVPRVSSENRPYLPVGVTDGHSIISERNFVLYDAPLWNAALIASRLHLVWIGTVCVRMRTDFSYSNTLGWNTFPIPALSEQNKADLSRCAEGILLAREAHFPATIAELYDPDAMPADLRAAHDRNDETLERIYIGRRFKNDTERLEKLFELYTRMTTKQAAPPKKPVGRKKKGTDA